MSLQVQRVKVMPLSPATGCSKASAPSGEYLEGADDFSGPNEASAPSRDYLEGAVNDLSVPNETSVSCRKGL